MSTITSLLAQGTAVRRRLVLIGAALLSTLAALTAMAAVDAGAATVHDAHMSTGKATSALGMPKQARGALDHYYVVHFRNSTTQHVDLAIAKLNSDHCSDFRGQGAWEEKGWFGLNPGEEKAVFTTANKYAGYYAKSVDGGEWSGDYGPMYLYHQSFDTCLSMQGTPLVASGNSYGNAGMRMITLPDYGWGIVRTDYTINLT